MVVTPDQVIVAITQLEQDLPEDFGVWNLGQFLKTLDSLGNPDIVFENNKITMKNDAFKMSLIYVETAHSMIKTPDVTKIPLIYSWPEIFSCKMSQDQFENLSTIVNLNKFPHITFKLEGEYIKVTGYTHGQDTTNSVTLDLEQALTANTDSSNCFFQSLHLMNMVEDDYNVKFVAMGPNEKVNTDKAIGIFTGQKTNTTYMVKTSLPPRS